MICEEFRDRWEARDRHSFDVLEHRSECAACVAWAGRQKSFDEFMLATMVVGPPPELIARLARIPAAVFEASPVDAPSLAALAPTPFNLALEAVFIALIGIAAIAFGGFDPLASFGVAIGRLGNVLQAIPLVIDSPLLPYLQSLAFTAVEALATLVLVAVTVTHMTSETGGRRATERSAQ